VTTFDLAVDEVLRHEGGYANDPNDTGGETRWGISKAAYPLLDIAALTRDEAIAIYRRDYWDRLRGDELPPALALLVFDAGVHMGRLRAVSLLQEVLGVEVDGIIGPVTLQAARAAPLPDVLTDYCARRALVYTSLTSWTFFGRGWMRRLFAVYGAARTLVTT
jgi:lysozyme family protein